MENDASKENEAKAAENDASVENNAKAAWKTMQAVWKTMQKRHGKWCE